MGMDERLGTRFCGQRGGCPVHRQFLCLPSEPSFAVWLVAALGVPVRQGCHGHKRSALALADGFPCRLRAYKQEGCGKGRHALPLVSLELWMFPSIAPRWQHGQTAKIKPSNGCGKKAVPLIGKRRYDFQEFGGYLEIVAS